MYKFIGEYKGDTYQTDYLWISVSVSYQKIRLYRSESDKYSYLVLDTETGKFEFIDFDKLSYILLGYFEDYGITPNKMISLIVINDDMDIHTDFAAIEIVGSILNIKTCIFEIYDDIFKLWNDWYICNLRNIDIMKYVVGCDLTHNSLVYTFKSTTHSLYINIEFSKDCEPNVKFVGKGKINIICLKDVTSSDNEICKRIFRAEKNVLARITDYLGKNRMLKLKLLSL